MDWPRIVKTARLSLNETQEKFAARFGVSTNTVSRWETGIYSVPLDVVDWLLRDTKDIDFRVCPRCAGRGLIRETIGGLVKQ
jgi:transcriptional regulator with XRE-family HTH domain